MSRLAGFLSVSFADSQPDTRLLAGIAARQRHRGFGEALVECHGPLAVAIHATPQDDPTAAARCRAGDAARGLLLVMDGMFFNRDELERELQTPGARAIDRPSAAELALAAYLAWGEACFSRLSGIFAIVILDQARGKCLLARDQFGAKPLNYCRQGDQLAFASEFRPLLALQRETRLDLRALLENTLHSEVLPPATLFEGVSAIPQGHYLVVERGHASIGLRRYHDPADVVDRAVHDRLLRDGPERYLDELDSHLHRNIREHMADSGSIGIAQSGGVDSAVLAAIAARYGKVRSIHVSVPQGRNLDERVMAERIAKHIGIPLSVVTMSGELYRQELVAATLAHETPLWHVQNVGFHLASRHAGELGVRTLLCGDTIGILLSPTSLLPWRFLQPLLNGASWLPASVTAFVQKFGFALGGLTVNSRGFNWTLPLTAQLVDGYARATLQQRTEAVYSFMPRVRRRMHGGVLAEVINYHGRFHHRGDRLGNASGVEYRTPFGDLKALALAMNVPYRFLMREGVSKWGVKALGLRYLPRDIAFQKKVAWDMPADIYLRPYATPRFFDDGFCAHAFGLSREAIRSQIDYWQRNDRRFARMVHTEIWGRLFILGETGERTTEWLASFEAAG